MSNLAAQYEEEEMRLSSHTLSLTGVLARCSRRRRRGCNRIKESGDERGKVRRKEGEEEEEEDKDKEEGRYKRRGGEQ